MIEVRTRSVVATESWEDGGKEEEEEGEGERVSSSTLDERSRRFSLTF